MRLRALALLGGLVLLLPAAAFGQSAGDEQYSDPFAGKSPAGNTAPAPAPAPAPTSSPGSSNSAPDSSGDQVASSSSPAAAASGDRSEASGTLPVTGFRSWMLGAIGAVMLLAGFLLRLLAGPPRAGIAGLSPMVLGRDVLLRRGRR